MDPVIVIAGPTASGKSALAVRLAEALNGAVINADSMQVYRELPVVTAQPGPAERARAPHRLYGVLRANEPCSAGRWRAMALDEIGACTGAGRLPIVVGGTGLYLRALMQGLAPVPAIAPSIRAAGQALLAEIGSAALHRRLAEHDPESAARIGPSDAQRLLRAWEVLEATGRPLSDWRQAPAEAGPSLRFVAFALLPPRPAVYAACDARFLEMLDRGALAEVAGLPQEALEPGLPAMKAVGVRELAAYLAGTALLSDAIASAQRATRRYAKRQYTWLRHQLPEAEQIHTQFSESLASEFMHKIRRRLLTLDG